MRLYKEALVALLAGLTYQTEGGIRWSDHCDRPIDIKSLGNDRYMIKAVYATYWFWGNKLHREDGPAIEYGDGTKYWYVNDQLHRENGPAVEYESGYREHWLNGKMGL